MTYNFQINNIDSSRIIFWVLIIPGLAEGVNPIKVRDAIRCYRNLSFVSFVRTDPVAIRLH